MALFFHPPEEAIEGAALAGLCLGRVDAEFAVPEPFPGEGFNLGEGKALSVGSLARMYAIEWKEAVTGT